MTDEVQARPLVWYMGTGYTLPAGIEAHILHYATEMRNHGFDTRVVVFKPLPSEKHRFLRALEERDIPIVSLHDASRGRADGMARRLHVPWRLWLLARRRAPPPSQSFQLWVGRRAGIQELRRRLRRERPDLIHVFGRLPHDAWRELPAARAIFHEMMTGTVDSHWNEEELREFRGFAGRAARYFAPGSGVAANVRREFGVTRRIDPIFTMCPDEAGDRSQESGDRSQESGDRSQETGVGGRETGDRVAVSRARGLESGVQPPAPGPRPPLRFGVICRLTGQKGIQFLLPALQAFKERHGDVRFLFAGIGPMEEEILRFAGKHGMSNVTVVRVPSAPEVLRRMDVFVHPSVDDAMPVSIAEALMCGIPCVVCRVGGCADLVRDGVEGFVIEPRRTDQILAALEKFAEMPAEEFAAYRQHARARYEEVCLPGSVGHIVAEHYRAVIREAM